MTNYTQGYVKGSEQPNYVGNNSTYHEWTEGVTITPVKRTNNSVKEQRRQALDTAKEKAKDDLREILAKRGHNFKSARKNEKLWKKVKAEYQKRKKEYFQEIISSRQSYRDRVKNQISNASTNIKFPVKNMKLDKSDKAKAFPGDKKSLVKTVSLKVSFFSQAIENPYFNASWSACFDASVAMAKQSGATVLGPDHRIQIATSEDKKGKLTVDSTRVIEGRNYIGSELENGRPVVVGVSHRDSEIEKGKKYNVDKITDHFVVITGQGTDSSGRTYYKFIDPGTKHESTGSDDNIKNRFYVDEETGKLYKPGKDATGYGYERRYEVSMVRRNEESSD